jgi:H+/Cl- antiporter ClcA
MRNRLLVILVALVIGVIDALVFKSFEYVVNHGTNFIWNDVFKTDIHRWIVIPLAIVLSCCLSILFKLVREKRVVEPETDSLKQIGKGNVTLRSIGLIALIGICSLLAGASLGPEASLVGICAGIGTWLAIKSNLDPAAELLTLSSVGALLVAFFGSILPISLPLLLLNKKKRLSIQNSIPVLIAGFSTYGTLWLINHNVVGYGNITIVPSYRPVDLLLGLALGMSATALGKLLKFAITEFSKIAMRIDASGFWMLAAGCFGFVIGVLYLIGGESVQFSGSEGSKLLAYHTPQYGAAALIIIIVAKLAVTSWSLAAGYRGGLVFPSIFTGLAIGLLVEQLFSGAGPGVVIGSIAGILGSMTNPAAALIFIASILPIHLIGVAVAGIIGSVLGNKILSKMRWQTAG